MLKILNSTFDLNPIKDTTQHKARSGHMLFKFSDVTDLFGKIWLLDVNIHQAKCGLIK